MTQINDTSNLSRTHNNDKEATRLSSVSSHIENPSSRFKLSILRYVAGPLVAIIAYVASNGGHFHISNDDLSPLIWAIFSYIIAQHVEQFITNREYSNNNSLLLDAIITQVDDMTNNTLDAYKKSVEEFSGLVSNLNVSLVDGSTCLERIAASVGTARYVRNTFVNLSDLTGVNSAESRAIIERYEVFLKKGQNFEWHDVVGLQDFF